MGDAKLYRWDDENAPVLSGQQGSLVALFNSVLVDGYGSKTPLGWEKVFYEVNKAVYRPSEGTDKLLYRINDGYGSAASIRVYESMSTIDAGVGMLAVQFADETNDSSAAIYKSATADGTIRKWIIFGDAAGFWLFICDGRIDAYYRRSSRALPYFLGQPIDVLGLGNHALCLPHFYGGNTEDIWYDDITTPNNYAARIHRSVDGTQIGQRVRFTQHGGLSLGRKGSLSFNGYYNGEDISTDNVYLASTDNLYLPRVRLPGIILSACFVDAVIKPFGSQEEDGTINIPTTLSTSGLYAAAYMDRWLRLKLEGYRP